MGLWAFGLWREAGIRIVGAGIRIAGAGHSDRGGYNLVRIYLLGLAFRLYGGWDSDVVGAGSRRIVMASWKVAGV